MKTYEIIKADGKTEYINADYADANVSVVAFYANGSGCRKPTLVGLYPLSNIKSVRLSIDG